MEGKCLSIDYSCHMLAMEYAYSAKKECYKDVIYLKMYYISGCRNKKLIRIFCKFLVEIGRGRY
jgi:hypothetical protein